MCFVCQLSDFEHPTPAAISDALKCSVNSATLLAHTTTVSTCRCLDADSRSYGCQPTHLMGGPICFILHGKLTGMLERTATFADLACKHIQRNSKRAGELRPADSSPY